MDDQKNLFDTWLDLVEKNQFEDVVDRLKRYTKKKNLHSFNETTIVLSGRYNQYCYDYEIENIKNHKDGVVELSAIRRSFINHICKIKKECNVDLEPSLTYYHSQKSDYEKIINDIGERIRHYYKLVYEQGERKYKESIDWLNNILTRLKSMLCNLETAKKHHYYV